MEIVVEVGTEDQKEIIKSEISMIYGLIDEIEPRINLHQVIIPINFEDTVRDLSGNQDYKAIRGQVALAKQ